MEVAALFTHTLGLESNWYGKLGVSPKSCKVREKHIMRMNSMVLSDRKQQHMRASHGDLAWITNSAPVSRGSVPSRWVYLIRRARFTIHEQRCQRKDWESCSLCVPVQAGASNASERPSKHLSSLDGPLQHEVAPPRLSPDSSALCLDWSDITNSMPGTIKNCLEDAYLRFQPRRRTINWCPYPRPRRDNTRKRKIVYTKSWRPRDYALWTTSVTYLL